jgi:hypothetical protein
MPRPKSLRQPDTSRAARFEFFAGRTPQIAEFIRIVGSVPEDGFPVLVFDGLGGQGKSALIRHLARHFTKLPSGTRWSQLCSDDSDQVVRAFEATEGERIPFAVINFEETMLRIHPADALLRIRRQLGRGYADGFPDVRFPRLKFPRFDLSYAVLWAYQQPTKLSRENNFLPEEADTILTLISALPGLGLLQGVQPAGKTVRWLLDWSKGRDHGAYVERIRYLEPVRIEDELPQALAADIEEQLSENAEAQRSPDRCVLFLDTYEALWQAPQDRIQVRWHKRDTWIRKMVQASPRSFLVIGARDVPRWRQLDESWAELKSFHQVTIDRLPEHDCRLLLHELRVTNPDTQSLLIRITDGSPWGLLLAADVLGPDADSEPDAHLQSLLGRAHVEEDLLDLFLNRLPSEEYRVALEKLSLADLSRLSWKWKGRSTVKIAERAREETTKALQRRREGRHFEAALAGTGAGFQAL